MTEQNTIWSQLDLLSILGEEPSDELRSLLSEIQHYYDSVRAKQPQVPAGAILRDISELLHQVLSEMQEANDAAE